MSERINHGRRGFLAFGLLAAGGWRHAAIAASLPLADASTVPLAELMYGQVRFGPGPLVRPAMTLAAGTTPTPLRPAPRLGNG